MGIVEFCIGVIDSVDRVDILIINSSYREHVRTRVYLENGLDPYITHRTNSKTIFVRKGLHYQRHFHVYYKVISCGHDLHKLRGLRPRYYYHDWRSYLIDWALLCGSREIKKIDTIRQLITGGRENML